MASIARQRCQLPPTCSRWEITFRPNGHGSCPHCSRNTRLVTVATVASFTRTPTTYPASTASLNATNTRPALYSSKALNKPISTAARICDPVALGNLRPDAVSALELYIVSSARLAIRVYVQPTSSRSSCKTRRKARHWKSKRRLLCCREGCIGL